MTDLLELNRLFTAWVETIYHRRTHSETGQPPLVCRQAGGPFPLVGQPTLRRRMKLGVLAALDQRIALRYAMPPMTGEETSSYLRHHLTLAGRSDTLFSGEPPR